MGTDYVYLVATPRIESRAVGLIAPMTRLCHSLPSNNTHKNVPASLIPFQHPHPSYPGSSHHITEQSRSFLDTPSI